MLLSDLIPETINKLNLTDFLNYAIRCGHNVNDNLQHWIEEYNVYVNEKRGKEGN